MNPDEFGEQNQVKPEQDIADRLERIEYKLTHPKKQNRFWRVFWMGVRTYIFLFSAVGFMLFIERFLKADVLAKVGS